MSEPIALRGMTWSHPRGYDPLVAASAEWLAQTGLRIEWDKRSLQDFESFPVEELARGYDLIVIDHPHVGQITAENCLAPFEADGRDAALGAIAAGSVGQSFASYILEGHQWALPIDAAAQVQVFRPDLLGQPVTRWTEALAVARDGGAVLPLRPPHSLMCFFTLAANLGTPCASSGRGPLIGYAEGIAAVEHLKQLVALVPPDNFALDPIVASEAMAAEGSPLALMPLGYGYVSYARAGFRPYRLGFADIPAAGDGGPRGSTLGGTGIAVSAFSRQIEAARDFAVWVAGAQVQRGTYAHSGGQPGHAAAWEDDAVNADTGGFYRNTRQTLELAWVRPRHRGYMRFQAAGSERLNEGLLAHESSAAIVEALNALYEESF